MITATAPEASDAWVSPDGKFYPVKYGNHWQTAHLIQNPNCSSVMDCFNDHGTCPNKLGSSALENAGWLHISGGSIYYNKSEDEITNSQVDVLYEMHGHIAGSGFVYEKTFVQEFKNLFGTVQENLQFAL